MVSSLTIYFLERNLITEIHQRLFEIKYQQRTLVILVHGHFSFTPIL